MIKNKITDTAETEPRYAITVFFILMANPNIAATKKKRNLSGLFIKSTITIKTMNVNIAAPASTYPQVEAARNVEAVIKGNIKVKSKAGIFPIFCQKNTAIA